MGEFVFVHGQPRSGTSALVQVLNAHPDLAIGMERYQRLWSPERIGELQPPLFEGDRFFDFSDGLTSNAPSRAPDGGVWGRFYADLEPKWETARYRGDKVLTLKLLRLWDAFPDARVVTIVRPIEQIAHSYAERAARAARSEGPGGSGRDTWGRDNDAQRAVRIANRMLAKIRQASTRFPDRLLVVDYDRFFTSPASLAAVLSFLSLPGSASLDAAWRAASEHYLAAGGVRDKPRPLPPDDLAYLADHANTWLWRQVSALAVG